MAQMPKRARKYRKTSKGGEKYNIDNKGKRAIQEKPIPKDEDVEVKSDSIDLDDYEDFD